MMHFTLCSRRDVAHRREGFSDRLVGATRAFFPLLYISCRVAVHPVLLCLCPVAAIDESSAFGKPGLFDERLTLWIRRKLLGAHRQSSVWAV
jgi:hypothetical protein